MPVAASQAWVLTDCYCIAEVGRTRFVLRKIRIALAWVPDGFDPCAGIA
jgi:hypothetical protein